MTREPIFYHRLYYIMYNGEVIPFHVGSRKLHTIIKYDKKMPANKCHSKYDQNCVFGSVESSFSAIGNSRAEGKSSSLYLRLLKKTSINKKFIDI